MTNDEAKTAATTLLASNSRFSGAEIEALEGIEERGLDGDLSGLPQEAQNSISDDREQRLKTIARNHNVQI